MAQFLTWGTLNVCFKGFPSIYTKYSMKGKKDKSFVTSKWNIQTIVHILNLSDTGSNLRLGKVGKHFSLHCMQVRDLCLAQFFKINTSLAWEDAAQQPCEMAKMLVFWFNETRWWHKHWHTENNVRHYLNICRSKLLMMNCAYFLTNWMVWNLYCNTLSPVHLFQNYNTVQLCTKIKWIS